MKNKKIAEDLLNLYAEGLLSQESKDFVEENLRLYKDLREKLELIEKDSIKIQNNHSTSFSFLAKKIKKDKKTYGLILASFFVSIVLLVFSFLTKPIHYEDDGKLYQVRQTEDKVFVSFNKDVIKVDIEEGSNQSGSRKNIYLDAYTTRLDQILNKASKQTISFDKGKASIYYANQDKMSSLVYGSKEDNVKLLPRLIFNSYFIIICSVSVVLSIIFFLIRKYRRLIKYIIFLPLTYLLAYILVCGFKFYSYYPQRDFVYIGFLWFSLYILMISIIKLFMVRRDKKI